MNTFLKYLPSILQAIVSVQAALPLLKGTTKKNLVLNLIALGTGVAGGIPNEHVAEVSQLIDASVSVLKTAGVFGKDQTPAVTTAAVHPVITAGTTIVTPLGPAIVLP